jgi:PhnB protein
MADVHPIPDDYPRLTAYITVDGAAAAIDFYRDVLGAEPRVRMDQPDGRVGHAELAIGPALLMLSDEFPERDILGPRTRGGTSVVLNLYVEDVDDTYARAVARGATAERPPADQFYGDRSGVFVDPFGHRWNVASHVEDVPPDELARRAAALDAEQAGGG